MKFLVDTQIFIWIFIEPHRFSAKAKSFLEETDSNEFFLSDVTAWEASIKYGLGKLKLPEKPDLFFPDRVRRADYRHLRIDLRHVTTVYSLPNIHRDPFDRLLVSQAKIEDLALISSDPIFKRYKIKTLTLRDIS